MLEMNLYIHGRVQGVGYRYSIVRHIESDNLMLRGFVKNLPNGTVHIRAQGNIEDLKSLRQFAFQGPEKALVRDIEESLQEVSEELPSGFDIQY